MNFFVGMIVGILLVLLVAEVALWWRRQNVRYGLTAPNHEVANVQDRPTIRQAEIERRRNRFVAVHPSDINIGAVIQIESSGNPRAVSGAGCRGLCQIAESTWIECTARMGVDWSWQTDAFDPGCNRAVGQFYINTRIPEMLRHYGIRDTVTTRLGAYNWGIGNLQRAWNQHGHEWLAYAPRETRNYVCRYAEIMARQPQ